MRSLLLIALSFSFSFSCLAEDTKSLNDVLSNFRAKVKELKTSEAVNKSNSNLDRETIINFIAKMKRKKEPINISIYLGNNLNGLDLRNIDFSGTILYNVSFYNSKLDNCNFSGAFLENADFENASMKNVAFHIVYSECFYTVRASNFVMALSVRPSKLLFHLYIFLSISFRNIIML